MLMITSKNSLWDEMENEGIYHISDKETKERTI